MKWCDFSQKFPIPLRGFPGAVDDHHVCVVGKDLNHCTGFRPLAWLQGVALVLDHNGVTNGEGLEWLGPELESFFHPTVPLGECSLPMLSFNPPLLSWSIFGQHCWEVVTQFSSKQNHCWAQPSHRIWCVAVSQQ